MLPKKSFYFVRHGITPWNLETRIQGSQDIELHDLGREQARALQDICSSISATHIFYSPMKRTIETMNLLNAQRNLPSTALSELKEWHRGALEGQLISYAESVNHSAHDAEPQELFFERTLLALHHITQHNEVPLIVAHAGTFKALCHYADIPFRESIPNCKIVQFRAPENETDCWTLSLINTKDN